jgi:hypothetical protein
MMEFGADSLVAMEVCRSKLCYVGYVAPLLWQTLLHLAPVASGSSLALRCCGFYKIVCVLSVESLRGSVKHFADRISLRTFLKNSLVPGYTCEHAN